MLEVKVLCRRATPSEIEREVLQAALTDAEAQRRARFLRAEDADRFLVGRGTLRLEVARMLGIAARDVSLDAGVHGKPLVAGGTPHVNVSHAGDVVLIALCASTEVGVDVELIDERYADRSMIEHSFSDREIADFDRLPGELRVDAFFHTWASREAVMKVHGAGFSFPRESFDVSVDPRQPPQLLAARPPVPTDRAVTLMPLRVPARHVAMLAIADDRPHRVTLVAG